MQSLDTETNPPNGLESAAEMVMETVSVVTRAIRREMRRQRPAELSMPQFRALSVLWQHPGASLSRVAGHLGLTTATASRLIDGLVRQGLVTREDSPEDRRRVVLHLTTRGQQSHETAHKAALGRLAEMLATLGESDHHTVIRAMQVLRRLLADEGSQ